MDWLAPVAAIMGVIVGGILNAVLGAEFERRRELVIGSIAARLVSDELARVDAAIESSLDKGTWGAILDPGLPYSPGLWAVEHRDAQREESAWPMCRADLARCLTLDEWQVVTKPYALVAGIATQFMTDDPGRAISGVEREYFQGLRTAIPHALAAMEPIANERRVTRLMWLLPALTRARGERDISRGLRRARANARSDS